MHSVDLTRRFSVVRLEQVRVPFDHVVGEVGGAGPQVGLSWVALVMLAPSRSGAMETAFEITVEWAFDRYSFGRPLASYQELKHRFADMKAWLEASHAVTDAAIAAALRRLHPTPTELAQSPPRPSSASTAGSWCRTACRCTAASA